MIDKPQIEIEAEIQTIGRTGVEMEALTAVSVAALTVYDMCKAVDREMVIGDVRLIKKTGGKSGEFHIRLRDAATLEKKGLRMKNQKTRHIHSL